MVRVRPRRPSIAPRPSAPGSIHGVVQDESGAPVGGAVVSALGTTTAYRRDRSKRPIRTAGALAWTYLLRAHSSGYIALTRPDDRGAAEQPDLFVDRPPAGGAAGCQFFGSGSGHGSDERSRNGHSTAVQKTAIPKTTAQTVAAPILRAGVGLPARLQKRRRKTARLPIAPAADAADASPERQRSQRAGLASSSSAAQRAAGRDRRDLRSRRPVPGGARRLWPDNDGSSRSDSSPLRSAANLFPARRSPASSIF